MIANRYMGATRSKVFLAGAAFLAVHLFWAMEAGNAQDRQSTAAGTGGTRAENPFKSPSEVPQVLLQNLRGTEESYIARLLRPLRSAAGADHILDEKDIAVVRQRAEARARAREVQNVLNNDLNGDGVVTRAEVEQALPAFGIAQRYTQRAIERLMAHDLNGDNRVTIAEVLKNAKDTSRIMSRAGRQADQLKDLLDADPNGDKRLTVGELKALGHAAFAAFDADGDGVISIEERRAVSSVSSVYRRARRGRPSRAAVARCHLPAADKGAEVVLVGSYEAGVVSNVTVSGQERTTETALLRIEPGASPLYVIAASYRPMIWRLNGAVKRVARFVAIPMWRSAEANVGVIGLSKDRVTFLPAGACFRYFKDSRSGAALQAKAVVQAKLGVPVNKVIANYALMGSVLPSGQLVSNPRRGTRGRGRMQFAAGNKRVRTKAGLVQIYTGSVTRPLPPRHVDANTFSEFYRFNPGGIVNLDAASVTSPGRAEYYDILPGEAGLIQLMTEGRIKRLSDGVYYVQKPVARYPAGLAGAHSVVFMLAKGIPQPKGNPGHSCVLSEATGQPVGRVGPSCRRYLRR